MIYVFKTKNGVIYSVNSPDADRARCAAKKVAGANWDPSAKIVKITNAI